MAQGKEDRLSSLRRALQISVSSENSAKYFRRGQPPARIESSMLFRNGRD